MKGRLRIVAAQRNGRSLEESVIDQRTAQRYSVCSEQVRLRTALVARLVDESYDGTGLQVDDVTGLSVGQTVRVEDGENDQSVEGVIIHLTPTDDGRWKVGVQLDESHVPI